MLAEMLTWWVLQQWTEFALWVVDDVEEEEAAEAHVHEAENAVEL